jgi:cytoskeleton protein RodZ
MRNAQAPLWPELTEKSSMGSFGERMQREREMRSITLDEIAEHTKISKRNLTALETENFSQLPGGIFNKGFVRAYARYIGIDEEQAVSDYLAAETEKLRKKMPIPIDHANGAGPRPELVVLERPAESEREPQADQAAGFMKAAVALVVLLGVGGLGYRWMQSRNAEAPAPVQPKAQVAQTVPPVPAATTTTTTSVLESQPAANTPAAVELNSASANGPSGAFKLALKTKEESWVQVKADGKVLMEGVLAPNSNKSFDANNELVIKLGNAAGVELAYNGKPLPQFDNADRGKTKTLTFTPQGLAASVR